MTSLWRCDRDHDHLFAGAGFHSSGLVVSVNPSKIGGPLRGLAATKHGGGVVGLVEMRSADPPSKLGNRRQNSGHCGLERDLARGGAQLGRRDGRGICCRPAQQRKPRSPCARWRETAARCAQRYHRDRRWAPLPDAGRGGRPSRAARRRSRSTREAAPSQDPARSAGRGLWLHAGSQASPDAWDRHARPCTRIPTPARSRGARPAPHRDARLPSVTNRCAAGAPDRRVGRRSISIRRRA